MRFKQKKDELFLTLKLEEAMELRDSLNDLIEKNDTTIHHHICSYNFDTGTIGTELIVTLE